MDFSKLNTATSKSFHHQKSVIKKVLAGKSVKCELCGDFLRVTNSANGLTLTCKKNCTDIQLDATLIK